MVQAKNFIKYTRLTFSTANNIMLFYENVQVHALRHRIILISCEKITTTSEILHLDLPADAKVVVDTTLIKEFREEGVVASLST